MIRNYKKNIELITIRSLILSQPLLSDYFVIQATIILIVKSIDAN